VLASRDRNVIKRNMAALPAYSFILGLLALLGYMAIKAGIVPITSAAGKPDNNTIVPLLFDNMFPSWFAGVAFAAIGIGALVPAAIMSIAAANLWTRNIYKEYINKDATPKQEARSSKLASLVVKFGALLAILGLDPQFSIDLQLIGGIIILQTLPAVALGLYTRWFHRWALISGLLAGLAVGFWTTFQIQQTLVNPDKTVTIVKAHFGGSGFPLSKLGLNTTWSIYAGFLALLANLVVCVIATFVLRALKAPEGEDRTQSDEYFADRGDPRVHELPAVVH
jgi:SSS family solute:Na+ symporter